MSKSHVAFNSITALGHSVSNLSIGTIETHVEPIAKFPVPTSAAALSRWLGMVGYYRKFIKGSASDQTYHFTSTADEARDVPKAGPKRQMYQAGRDPDSWRGTVNAVNAIEGLGKTGMIIDILAAEVPNDQDLAAMSPDYLTNPPYHPIHIGSTSKSAKAHNRLDQVGAQNPASRLQQKRKNFNQAMLDSFIVRRCSPAVSPNASITPVASWDLAGEVAGPFCDVRRVVGLLPTFTKSEMVAKMAAAAYLWVENVPTSDINLRINGGNITGETDVMWIWGQKTGHGFNTAMSGSLWNPDTGSTVGGTPGLGYHTLTFLMRVLQILGCPEVPPTQSDDSALGPDFYRSDGRLVYQWSIALADVFWDSKICCWAYKFLYVNDPTRAAYRKSENNLFPAERALASDFWQTPPPLWSFAATEALAALRHTTCGPSSNGAHQNHLDQPYIVFGPGRPQGARHIRGGRPHPNSRRN
ncbi:hypothetical protein L198_02462 [Cryptococcus wingfieldii CBS 7118]|uniref:Uncharacterized protein n=1 Tax=Cryptococcus wingfieldii CBS 7118 TaxID=1295528 RepID=A0A1E3JUK4_9TREE|nr:hypothetical protein L198_02462 [Cryptococcus wingfieldii CBS 7118]ODO03612.1 hypothetical protein L198_02462 [Cryptococcus wingfieldii CBS 7118]